MDILWNWAWVVAPIIVAVLLIAAEVLDWIGRLEIIEKRFPPLWKIINNRPARLLLSLLLVVVLSKDISERLKIPALAINTPAPAAPTIVFSSSSNPKEATTKAPKRQLASSTAINGNVSPKGNCNVIQNGGTGNSANPNCGPPEPSIRGAESIPSDPPSDGRGHPRTTIKFYLNANPISQKFFAKCYRSCSAERAEPYPNPGLTTSSDYTTFTSTGDPRFAGWQINRHFEANEYISLTVVSRDEQPVKITSLSQIAPITR